MQNIKLYLLIVMIELNFKKWINCWLKKWIDINVANSL